MPDRKWAQGPFRAACREGGIGEGTYYRWKAKGGGTDVSQLQRLRQLEDENGRLKRIVARVPAARVA